MLERVVKPKFFGFLGSLKLALRSLLMIEDIRLKFLGVVSLVLFIMRYVLRIRAPRALKKLIH